MKSTYRGRVECLFDFLTYCRDGLALHREMGYRGPSGGGGLRKSAGRTTRASAHPAAELVGTLSAGATTPCGSAGAGVSWGIRHCRPRAKPSTGYADNDNPQSQEWGHDLLSCSWNQKTPCSEKSLQQLADRYCNRRCCRNAKMRFRRTVESAGTAAVNSCAVDADRRGNASRSGRSLKTD